MPASRLANTQTQDTFVDALTVIFDRPRTGFSLAVFNAAVIYQLATSGVNPRDVRWEASEQILAPSFSSFNNVEHEGLPTGSHFAGIRLHSAVSGTPATVTVT